MPLAPFSHNSVFLRRQHSFVYAQDVNFIVLDEDLEPTTGLDPTESATLANTLLAQSRNLLFTLTDAAPDTLIAAFTVTGKNQFGTVVSESIEIDYDSSPTGETANCYSEVTSIVMDSQTNAAASDLLNVGVGTRFGIPYYLTNVNQVKSILQVPVARDEFTAASAGTASNVILAYQALEVSGFSLTNGDMFVVDFELAPDSRGTLR